MIIGRRTFIQRTALLAAAPSFVGLLTVSLAAPSAAAPPSGPLQMQPVAGGSDFNCTAFKIEGWDHWTDSADLTMIRINQAWKTAWR